MNESELAGASILPVMTDPVQGKLYFLLAKERYHPSWAKGSYLWTDFGGKRDGSETAEQVAAREFVEESLGVVCFFKNEELPRTLSDDIARSFLQERYLLKFLRVFEDRMFVTFVVQVPWDPTVPQRFLDALNDSQVNRESCSLEKSHVGLFSSCQVLHAVKSKGYLMPHERCCESLTQALSIVLPELQFYFPHMF
jgi:hypothetical protein